MFFWRRAATADRQRAEFSIWILELAYEELDARPAVPNLPRNMLQHRRRRHDHRIAWLFGFEGEGSSRIRVICDARTRAHAGRDQRSRALPPRRTWLANRRGGGRSGRCCVSRL